MDKEKFIAYWIDSSDKDFKTMEDLYQTKNNNWALFMGHLVIEKLLKGLYIRGCFKTYLTAFFIAGIEAVKAVLRMLSHFFNNSFSCLFRF